MRALALLFALPLSFTILAQYGSFDASKVKNAKALTTIVVLDDDDTPYNRGLMDAIKADWKFSGGYEFVKAGDLAMQPITPENTYLLKTSKVDPVKFEGTFLTLVQGWKQKKGDALQSKDNAFTNIPAEHELAFILIDPKVINDKQAGSLLKIYGKQMQDYLKHVAEGKITDKTTADRIVSDRHRHIKDTELWLAQEHLDKTMPDAEKVKAVYTAPFQIKPMAQVLEAINEQDSGVTITDVVITGDHKNKHAFKRIFNAGTGELMYMNDDQAIYGKKEGFLDEDLKTIERAR